MAHVLLGVQEAARRCLLGHPEPEGDLLSGTGLASGIEAALDVGAVAWSKDVTIMFQHAMPEATELLVGITAFLYVWINRRRYAAE